MTAIIKEDGCTTDAVISASEQDSHQNTVEILPPNGASIPDVEPHSTEPNQDSVSTRRDRSFTAFLFEEIAGKKLKCYEKWKLWLMLFIAMTVIAVIAIVLATVFAVKYNNAFSTPQEAVTAQQTLLYQLIGDETSNISDHTQETRQIFNTFDDDSNGIWDFTEFSNHYAMASGVQPTFDNMDDNGDGILSWKEIAISLSKFKLSTSYIHRVQQTYNYTIGNSTDPSTDPLFNEYAANIYLQSHDAEPFEYITRARFYEFRANVSFHQTDTNSDDAIDFEEFINEIANEDVISLFRNWDLESAWWFSHGSFDNYSILDIDTADASLCPVHETSADRRRRLGLTDQFGPAHYVDGRGYGFFSSDGNAFYYHYHYEGCESVLVCKNEATGTWDEGCSYDQLEYVIQCISTTFHNYIFWGGDPAGCISRLIGCMVSIKTPQCSPVCECYCNGECYHPDDAPNDGRCGSYCPGPPEIFGNVGGSFRRRVGSCKRCGCSCTSCESQCGVCFGGNNEMLIKRNDVIQSVPLREMLVGDYVETKSSEWSKVWFIKKQLGDFEFLNLYYDEDEYITVTHDHLLYVDDISDESMKTADEIRIGDNIFILNNRSISFVKKQVIYIESVVSSDGAYSPVTMEGSVVVSNVLSSCYAQSPEIAQKFHDAAAIFRWISTINTNVAVYITSFFYDIVFVKIRERYGLKVAFALFNGYSTPFIVIVTALITVYIAFIPSFYHSL